MAEITGLKCNECGRKIFVEDEESPRWATSVMTIPSADYRKTIHHCPDCVAPHIKKAHDAEEKLSTGQRKVIDPGHVDPKVQAMFQPEPLHDEDSRKSGVPISDWPTGDPWQPAAVPTAPVALTAGDTEGVPVFPWPAGPLAGGPPPPRKPPKKRRGGRATAAVAGGRVASFLTLCLAVAGTVLIQV